jgi:gliding motility-associated-like protein
MHKPLLPLFLFLLLTSTGIAQQISPFRKLYADPDNPGILLDSAQIRIAKARAAFMLKEAAQTPVPLNTPVKSISRPLSNNCGVKASFTPANDTTLYTGQDITFTNTSTNADSYEWINDVYQHSTTTDYNFVPDVGVTPIMLVAHKGTCTDTAITYVVRNGTAPTDVKRMNISYGLPNTNELVSCMARAKADGYLLAGVSSLSNDIQGYGAPYFVRVSETGCILWSRRLPLNSRTTVRSLITTYDSGFVVQVLLRDDVDHSYLLKLDKNGNIVWTRSYPGASGLNWYATIREISDHSLMVLAGQFGAADFTLTRLTEQGDFQWQKIYGISDAHQASFSDLVEKDGSAYVVGNLYLAVDPASNLWNGVPMLYKVDAATGDLLWSKGYTSPNKAYSWSGIHFYKDGLIMNGFADSLIVPANNQWINSETLLETDLDGNIREGKLIYDPAGIEGTIADNLLVEDDNSLRLFYSGSITFALQPGFADKNYFLKLDANKNMEWRKYYFSSNADYLAQAVPAPERGMAMIGQRMNKLFNPFYGFAENLVLLKVDAEGAGPDGACYESELSLVIRDLEVTPYSPNTSPVHDGALQIVDLPITGTRPNSELRYNCPDYVPLCSFMKLSGKSFVCNMKDTMDFIAHKDPSCADPVIWTYDLSNIKTVYQDGNKVRLLFNAPGVYKILAEKPFPCTGIMDSILVNVAAGLIHFDLGNDTILCKGDSLVLRPKEKYDLYLWQDGSMADSFKVKTAGQYTLTVTDSCGNTKSDMIQVDFKTSLTLDLGAPRWKCKTDSLIIVPPDGFQEYDWSPLYQMTTSGSNGVILFPAKDTTYRLSVRDAGGCTGSAELPIHIYAANAIDLGNDTAICPDGHAVFSAASDFSTYTWSNGEATKAIDVQTPGQYILQTTDENNCRLSDTVALTVFQKPGIHITGGTIICKDQTILLDAGAGFASYQWQDGTRTESYQIADTGFYRVQVTDLHQCSTADSIHFSQYAESPRHYLPADTTICLYGMADIEPAGNFAQYSWSTGSTGRSIQVKTAGEYVLQVVDAQGCRGTDSIRIETKDCDAILIFPNAFTPNQDGINDVFRLKYPGYVSDYQLQIFNRWGQIIYHTSDPYGQWDGMLGGEKVPTGSYIWVVRFTDRTGKKQALNGSVLLIR